MINYEKGLYRPAEVPGPGTPSAMNWAPSQQHQAPELNKTTSAPSNLDQSNRTYTELQTVRGGSRVTDATQVLRQHHQISSQVTVLPGMYLIITDLNFPHL